MLHLINYTSNPSNFDLATYWESFF
uniref:Uncharacterized protein n=1 Tax=Rhizophora mucronata TaxID=61149 RepID=A0A2P2MV09_RHIMU